MSRPIRPATPNDKRTVRIAGRRYPVIGEMVIRRHRYLLAKRLAGLGHTRYLAADADAGFEPRLDLVLPRSKAADAHVRVLKWLPPGLLRRQASPRGGRRQTALRRERRPTADLGLGPRRRPHRRRPMNGSRHAAGRVAVLPAARHRTGPLQNVHSPSFAPHFQPLTALRIFPIALGRSPASGERQSTATRNTPFGNSTRVNPSASAPHSGNSPVAAWTSTRAQL